MAHESASRRTRRFVSHGGGVCALIPHPPGLSLTAGGGCPPSRCAPSRAGGRARPSVRPEPGGLHRAAPLRAREDVHAPLYDTNRENLMVHGWRSVAALPLLVLCSFFAACSHDITSPAASSKAVVPDLVCGEQLTTTVKLTGDGF